MVLYIKRIIQCSFDLILIFTHCPSGMKFHLTFLNLCLKLAHEKNDDFAENYNNLTHRCNSNSHMPHYEQTLHFALCGKGKTYSYEIMIRGVNKILVPSSLRSLTEAIIEFEKTSKKGNSQYMFVEGEWTSPVVTDYKCFQEEGKHF